MSKPKIRVKFKCPHCDGENKIIFGQYHKPLFGEHFKARDVLDFENINFKETSFKGAFDVISQMQAEFSRACDCCDKNIEFEYNTTPHYSFMKEPTHWAKLVKAGNYLNKDYFKKFLGIVKRLDRSCYPEESKWSKYPCEKSRYVRKFSRIYLSKLTDKKPYHLKINDKSYIGYIGKIDYALGYSENFTINFYNIKGELEYIDVSGAWQIQWLPVNENVIKEVLIYYNRM